FFLRDTKSSSGTFLNHARLSAPGVESKPTPLKDGDVVQLGVDYQGGTQEIYRCVKMRLELNRSWQQQANPFSENTLKAIRSLTTANAASSTDCCICLFRIASFQSLFVAPCSHVYHYKCIRPMLVSNHPGFLCPLCRTFADLEDTVEIDDPVEEEMPLQNAAAVIECGTGRQDSIENISDPEPVVAPSPLPPAESGDVSTAPTPPSVQAHTFQPPENRPSPMDLDPQLASANNGASPAQPSTPISPVHPRSSASATVAPLDIASAIAGSSTAAESADPQQQSPSSAFFMAPSPPMFVSSFGLSPIPFPAHSSTATNQRPPLSSSSTSPPTTPTQERHPPASPSSHVGHMIQNFVRNITIPHRNRSRTNSNSAMSPTTSTHLHTAGGSTEAVSGQQQQQSAQGVATDVFGKTLVMTPPPQLALSLSNHRSGTSHSGFSELGVVSEMEVEPSSMSLLEGGLGHGAESSSGNSGHRSEGNSSRSSSQSRGEMQLDDGVDRSLALHQSQTITAEASV
ncbi:hypothetical protein BGZ98_007915, partial [Dissophora globulifera]